MKFQMMCSGGHVLEVFLMAWLRGLNMIQWCTETTLDLLEQIHK